MVERAHVVESTALAVDVEGLQSLSVGVDEHPWFLRV